MQTAPPPRANFSETVNQWIIYDSYVAYEAAKEAAEEKEQKKEMKEVKVRIEPQSPLFIRSESASMLGPNHVISKDIKICT